MEAWDPVSNESTFNIFKFDIIRSGLMLPGTELGVVDCMGRAPHVYLMFMGLRLGRLKLWGTVFSSLPFGRVMALQQ
jgi:hypothetical protein